MTYPSVMSTSRAPYVVAAIAIVVTAVAVIPSGHQHAEAAQPQTLGPTAADLALDRAPVPHRYLVDGSELLVMDVPVKELEFVPTTQRCFVWRDAEFKTSTISCPQPPEVVLSPAPSNGER